MKFDVMDPLSDLLIHHGHGLIFIGVFAEQLGLPLPSALLMISAGALSGIGRLNVHFSFFWAMVGCLLGDQFWYHLGRRQGGSVLPFLCRISLNPDACVRRTRSVFSRYGEKSLLIVKFLPGVNAIAAPLSGVMQMNYLHFVLFDFLGACLWIGTYIGLLCTRSPDRGDIGLSFTYGNNIIDHIRWRICFVFRLEINPAAIGFTSSAHGPHHSPGIERKTRLHRKSSDS
jgi:membrane protein DedA with SNARE-associated domain